jgi:hypothetical protein
MNCINCRKVRLERLDPCGINRLYVCTGCIEVAYQLRRASLGMVGIGCHLIQNRAQLILVLLARLPSAAPAIHRCRNRVLMPPTTIRKFVEVVTRLNAAIQIADLNSFK